MAHYILFIAFGPSRYLKNISHSVVFGKVYWVA